MTSSDQFLIILRQPGSGPGPTPEKLQKIMVRFSEWMDGLYARNAVIGTNRLLQTGTVIRGSPGKEVITDGPYIEAKEVVGGYVMVKARSLKAAVALAKRCPGLDYGMTIEVRPVQKRPGR